MQHDVAHPERTQPRERLGRRERVEQLDVLCVAGGEVARVPVDSRDASRSSPNSMRGGSTVAHAKRLRDRGHHRQLDDRFLSAVVERPVDVEGGIAGRDRPRSDDGAASSTRISAPTSDGDHRRATPGEDRRVSDRESLPGEDGESEPRHDCQARRRLGCRRSRARDRAAARMASSPRRPRARSPARAKRAREHEQPQLAVAASLDRLCRRRCRSSRHVCPARRRSATTSPTAARPSTTKPEEVHVLAVALGPMRAIQSYR